MGAGCNPDPTLRVACERDRRIPQNLPRDEAGGNQRVVVQVGNSSAGGPLLTSTTHHAPHTRNCTYNTTIPLEHPRGTASATHELQRSSRMQKLPQSPSYDFTDRNRYGAEASDLQTQSTCDYDHMCEAATLTPPDNTEASTGTPCVNVVPPYHNTLPRQTLYDTLSAAHEGIRHSASSHPPLTHHEQPIGLPTSLSPTVPRSTTTPAATGHVVDDHSTTLTTGTPPRY